MADPLSEMIKEAVREALAETIKYGDLRPERLVDVRTAASYIGLSRSEVYDMVKHGELPVVRHGKCVLLDKDDLDSWIKTHKTHGTKDQRVA